MGEWISSSPIATLSTATRHLLPGSAGAHLPFIITAATADAYIYAINRDNMQQVGSASNVAFNLFNLISLLVSEKRKCSTAIMNTRGK